MFTFSLDLRYKSLLKEGGPMAEKTGIYALIFESNQIAERLIESGGELTPELESALDKNEMSLAQKTDSYSVITERL
jgi:hypothetical protein